MLEQQKLTISEAMLLLAVNNPSHERRVATDPEREAAIDRDRFTIDEMRKNSSRQRREMRRQVESVRHWHGWRMASHHQLEEGG